MHFNSLRTAVQEERGPRKSKSLNIRRYARQLRSTSVHSDLHHHRHNQSTSQTLPQPPVPPTLSHTIQPPPNLQHHILIRILVACLQTVAHSNEPFRRLGRPLQAHLLRHVWSECFVLRAAHCSVDVAGIVDECGSVPLRRALRAALQMRVDAMELSLLETIQLCRAGGFHS